MERQVEDADRYITTGFPVVVQCRTQRRPQAGPLRNISRVGFSFESIRVQRNFKNDEGRERKGRGIDGVWC